ncbi:bifunctional lysylphosphatidylglycerol flippase/synthetase MprF [Sphingomonas sp. ABOLE]|uniref:bifunctional lysylphosphatidylglycerol flippase/synthetase MprF n=1 Tax=Sphingomonas sp. ABOLE TaxID=1985878 RepID=UPI000F7DFEB7|nr:bifunctional lysylphosphatidylglycerol flippase/synthetase MprF [Sphingomonas sp. ABOLE]RSV38706.1 bifunctional lysylphosphatidylglycerol flippase/synthetase MprF [Sphingomonas sp. ABOLE]
MQIAEIDVPEDAPSTALGPLAWLARHRRPLLILITLALAALAFEAVRTILTEVHLRDVRHALHRIEPARLAAALALTAASYLALTLYDWFAVRAIGQRLPWRTAALASFTSYTISHNLGLSLLTGGTARLRAYGAAGLDFADVARITLIASATFWSGVFAVTAIALLAAPAPLTLFGQTLPLALLHGAGLAVLLAFAALFVARARGLAELRLGVASLPLPPVPLMAGQIGTAAIDLACASGALFVLIPHADPALIGSFFLAYALALVIALVTHVPGGIGVFEAVMLALVPIGRSGLFAALLLYRLVYYLLPLLVAGALLVGIEGRRLRRPIATGLSVAHRIGQALVPPLLALLVFGGGLVLLVSGALPPAHGRMHPLHDILPLPFVEGSHFAASLVGTALLLIAPAVQARLKSGFYAARLLLVAGAVFSIAKGIDYEEATVLLIVAGLLQYARPGFYRSAGIGSAPVARWWWAAALIALLLSAWAGFFAYKRVPYSDDLWWDFAWRGNAPRFLRATLGATMLLVGWAFWRLMSAAPRVREHQALDPQVAARAIAATSRADAMLAYTGDKDFLVSTAGDAFLMYRVQGRTWIVMGDPVGPEEAWSELIWEIRRRCDAARGRLCLFQVSAAMLPLVVELGLQPLKYGEEAVVDLRQGYDLKGGQFKSLRYSVKRATSEGLVFEVVPAAQVPALLPELQRVSDAWLADKPGAEKRFSLGRFDADYLAHFDCAVLRLEGAVVAFANLWETPNREEISVDLMRHRPDTPYGAMDLLFVRLLQYGAAKGFQRFNLGMAPLSGLKPGPLAPIWSRLGAAVYGHGERIYGFSGLRAFKQKFGPSWIPRYIGTTPGVSVPRALIDATILIGG